MVLGTFLSGKMDVLNKGENAKSWHLVHEIVFSQVCHPYPNSSVEY